MFSCREKTLANGGHVPRSAQRSSDTTTAKDMTKKSAVDSIQSCITQLARQLHYRYCSSDQETAAEKSFCSQLKKMNVAIDRMKGCTPEKVAVLRAQICDCSIQTRPEVFGTGPIMAQMLALDDTISNADVLVQRELLASLEPSQGSNTDAFDLLVSRANSANP